MSKLKMIAGGLLALTLLVGCGQAHTGQASGDQRTVTVLAAASLTESFDELAKRFTAEHPDVRVEFDYQGSSTLAEQIEQGRPADVFASADEKNMAEVADLVSPPQTFATNRLALVVPPGNPAHVASLADLAGTKLVTCAPQVPCGAATRAVAQAARVDLRPVSEESDVKQVLQKVVAGEADAGLVYVTDAKAAGDQVQTIDFPESPQAVNAYPIATLRDSQQAQLATEFVEFVRGPAGREVLGAHGFDAP
ncbi:molybdate ABC transporter substrate-binding protein [Saccharopolyspora rhizosphaerae]|uniref:Molybdate ABC transporter substrate-binding protein n=1 Tax=Saccharopolyspora rhizosphaerae TaxID=2492662 RepID=A0A3R8Q2Y5_9PSEU|nr:molybdate ABC transporter substrate-binding protein [Saccharopolyspora rhizosphaerae]RRO17357.1 molybdate ABC transporter substrate-binding protein [Saccharopolyspora rhizosphaerae]